jgi:hypothetical protein
MKQSLFQYAILWHPTEKQTKEGEKTKLLIDVKTVLAANQAAVTMMAAMEIPADYKEQLEQIDIVLRPF